MSICSEAFHHEPWNKGKLVGRKHPLKPEQVWSIRVRLELANKIRDLALFNIAVDSKLRGCDLVSLLVSDVAHGTEVQSRARIIQHKTQLPVSFEITQKTRNSLTKWISAKNLRSVDFLFPSSHSGKGHLTTRQYARLVDEWIRSIGLDITAYGTHSLRRTKPTIIYKETKNLRAVQILLGHTNVQSTIRYLGVEIDDALELSEKIEI